MNTRQFFVGRTIGFLAIIILVGGFFLIKNLDSTQIPQENISTAGKYSNTEYGISFTYPENYTVTEADAAGSEMRKRHAITLIRKADLPVPQGGEGPTSITIEMYQNNLDKQTTEQWILNSNESNFKLSNGVMATTTIDGLPARSYRWSGLYEGTTIVTAQPNWIYVLSVTYLEMGSDIVQDFVKIKESVKIAQ
jgi:hypothetical protein